MRKLTIVLTAFCALTIIPAVSQTADEIIQNYFENTGGNENWAKVESMKSTGKAGMGPQEFPFVQTMTADGKMAISIDLQGKNITVQAFDGESMWSTNFQSMKPEAQDSETSNNYKKNEAKDFPDPFFNYKEKGYKVEKLEDKTVEGVETYTIKLTKNPIMVDGKEEPSVTTYYFDKENFVPIMSETIINTGPQKGMQTQMIYSDYQEVGDVIVPFSMTQKFNGQTGQTIKVEEVILNPEIEESLFEMPTEE